MGKSCIAFTVKTIKLIFSENENLLRAVAHPDVRDWAFCSKQFLENVLSILLKDEWSIFRE